MSHIADDREAVLNSIRHALGSAYLPDAAASPPARQQPGEPPPAGEQLARFAAALEAVGGELRRAADDGEARRIVAALVAEAGGGDVLLWPDEELPLPLRETVIGAGGTPLSIHLPEDAAARLAETPRLDAPALGITGALAGLATTGSLALLSGERRAMAASLTPLTHVALLRAGDIVPDMAAFLRAHGGPTLTAGHRNLVFITGPSRTADIEMIITRGVHGPKRLVVVVVEERTTDDGRRTAARF